jgi:transmembrane sensor
LIIEDNHIDRIIARYIANEASQEDLLLLREWMDQAPENKRYVENIRLLQDKALAAHSPIQVDTSKAWEKVKAQLDLSAQVAAPKESRFFAIPQKIWTKAAAIFVLIIGVSTLFYYLSIGSSSDIIRYNLASANASVSKTIAGNIHVCLNRKTTITVVENKKAKTKELQLSGEAFIQVKHSADEQLVVKAGETLIKDIGTSFNVKANPGSSIVEVFVESGEVSFFTNAQSGIRLTKGETGIFDKQTKLFRINKTSNPNINSYKTHKFVFVNTPLSEAVKQINAVYPKAIILGDSLIGNRTLNVTFDNEDIDDIADVMSETLGLEVSTSGKGYILRK